MAVKQAPKKSSPKKTARKKASSEKSAGEKSSSKKAAKKTAAAAASEPAEEAAAATPDEGKASSLEVNMGHVFALRPRVNTSFKPGDFSTAKHLLVDETYANHQEAARAVVEKAQELTHGPPKGSRGRRF